MIRVLSYFVLKLTWSLCKPAYCTDCCTGMCSADCLQHNGHISLNGLHGKNKTYKQTYKPTYFVRRFRITFKHKSFYRPCCERINEDVWKQWTASYSSYPEMASLDGTVTVSLTDRLISVVTCTAAGTHASTRASARAHTHARTHAHTHTKAVLGDPAGALASGTHNLISNLENEPKSSLCWWFTNSRKGKNCTRSWKFYKHRDK